MAIATFNAPDLGPAWMRGVLPFMTPKQKVLRRFPEAHTYRLASYLVHVRASKKRDPHVIGWGSSPTQAWRDAAEKLNR